MERKSSDISLFDDLRAYRFRYPLIGTIIGAATLLLVGAMSVPFFLNRPRSGTSSALPKPYCGPEKCSVWLRPRCFLSSSYRPHV